MPKARPGKQGELPARECGLYAASKVKHDLLHNGEAAIVNWYVYWGLHILRYELGVAGQGLAVSRRVREGSTPSVVGEGFTKTSMRYKLEVNPSEETFQATHNRSK